MNLFILRVLPVFKLKFVIPMANPTEDKAQRLNIAFPDQLFSNASNLGYFGFLD